MLGIIAFLLVYKVTTFEIHDKDILTSIYENMFNVVSENIKNEQRNNNNNEILVEQTNEKLLSFKNKPPQQNIDILFNSLLENQKKMFRRKLLGQFYEKQEKNIQYRQ